MIDQRIRQFKHLGEEMMKYLELAYGLPKSFTRPMVKSQIKQLCFYETDDHVFSKLPAYWAEDLIDWYISAELGRFFSPFTEDSSWDYNKIRKDWIEDALRKAKAGKKPEMLI